MWLYACACMYVCVRVCVYACVETIRVDTTITYPYLHCLAFGVFEQIYVHKRILFGGCELELMCV